MVYFIDSLFHDQISSYGASLTIPFFFFFMISICPLPLSCRYTVDLPLPLVYRFTFTPLCHSFSLSYNALYCSNSGLPLLCRSLLFFPFCLFILFKFGFDVTSITRSFSYHYIVHTLELEKKLGP